MATEIREFEMMHPRYKHDCTSCLWLGQFEKYDLYACAQGGDLATIIARHGNRGEHYISGIGIDLAAIREGARRAVLIAIDSRISNAPARSSEARPGVDGAVESNTADEKPSAETGGEKTAPDYENDPTHKQCVGMADWRALLYEISKFYAKIDPEWADASIDQMGDFDPWEALRRLQPNFPSSPQNQTVSGGVEGAHEGTTADKSEPEKLNNAQLQTWIAVEMFEDDWDEPRPLWEDLPEADRNSYIKMAGAALRVLKVSQMSPKELDWALAESSLSSPPPTSDSSAPTVPESTGLSIKPAEGRTAKETRNG